MNTLFNAFWQDEIGFVVSAELVLVSTVSVLGVIAGLSHVRGAVVEEYKDLGDSFRSIDQSYSYSGFRGCKAFTAGSAFLEDCEDPEIHFTEIYDGCPTSCKTPCQTPCQSPCEVPCESCATQDRSPCEQPCGGGCANGCPTTSETIIHGSIQPTPCNGCETQQTINQGAIQPIPAQDSILNSACCTGDSNHTGPQEYEPLFEEGPRISDKVTDPNPHAIYNVRRYVESPPWPNAPHLVPKSPVW